MAVPLKILRVFQRIQVERTRKTLRKERSGASTKMPLAFLPDTSCMIAAVCSWHGTSCEAAAHEIERRLAGPAKMIVAAPALIEAYAVLTQLALRRIDLSSANGFDSARQIIS